MNIHESEVVFVESRTAINHYIGHRPMGVHESGVVFIESKTVIDH